VANLSARSDKQAGEATKPSVALWRKQGMMQPENYQAFSREPIVFHKVITQTLIKWTVVAGSAFRQEENHKIYIPVRIIGQPMRARSTVVEYLMNLELLETTMEQTFGYTFETIWPFILYVFNNWIKHQVKLMGVKRMLPNLNHGERVNF
jgi:hypothetical protein